MAKKSRTPFLNNLIDQLTRIGEKAILDAYNTRTFTNRTYNLHDSYASAVYIDGVLDKTTIRFVSQNELSAPYSFDTGRYYGGKTGKRSYYDWRGDRHHEGDPIYTNGREEAISYFKNYKPKTTKGIELVVIAAMFYTQILESGIGLRRKYKVISNANTILQKYAREMGAMVEPILWNGVKFNKKGQIDK